MAGGAAGVTGGAAGAAPSAEEAGPSLPPGEGARPGTLRQTAIAAVGGLTTGTVLVAALLAAPAVQPTAATLEVVASALLSEAGQSLDQTAGRQALDEARQCKAPLAYVTLAAAPGDGQPSRIRIRSGGYLSPTILITDAPRRVAIPFPAPYPSGRGVISIEGAAFGLNVWLMPGQRFSALNGTADIPVTWTPKNPC